jgi:hypothetical protein
MSQLQTCSGPVEITLKHRLTLPPQPFVSNAPRGQPQRLLPMRLHLILMHELADLPRGEPYANRHHRLAPP